jgi:hypothetical protein
VSLVTHIRLLANIKMKYLPFENITYTTNLSPEEVVERIQGIIEPNKTFRLTGIFGNSNHKPYEGTINRNSFSIKRIIGYRNSFLPRITGEIVSNFKGTKIEVKMRLHILVLIFMFIWCGGVGLGFITFLTSSINNGTFDSAIIVPFGMLAFGYGLTTGGFKYESIKSKNYLAQLFKAE